MSSAKAALKSDTKQARILRAARRLFTTQGFDATAIAEIAAEAGVADGTIYTYFANKRDLLYHVVRGLYDPLIDTLETEARTVTGFANLLRLVILRHLQSLSRDRDLCLLVLQQIRNEPDYDRSLFHELNRRYSSIVVRLVEEAIARGEVRPQVSPRLVRDMIYGALEHILWQSLLRGAEIDVETVTQELTALLLPGLLTAPAAPRTAEAVVERLEGLTVRMEQIFAAGRIAGRASVSEPEEAIEP
jgi:AcrR family transcriptional regulator